MIWVLKLILQGGAVGFNGNHQSEGTILRTLALSGRQSVFGMVRINRWPVRSKALLGSKNLATWQTS